MAGIPGPPPKPANKRQRRNKDVMETRVVQAVPVTQPPLPDDVPWPPQTLQWWRALGELPQAAEFNAVQWDHLMMTALIHADIWGNGNTRAIPDFQKAMSEYPILPAAMLRLRVTALTGDELVHKNQRAAAESKQLPRRGNLRAVEGA